MDWGVEGRVRAERAGRVRWDMGLAMGIFFYGKGGNQQKRVTEKVRQRNEMVVSSLLKIMDLK